MDKAALVGPDIDQGRKFLDLLQKYGIPVTAALWQKDEVFGEWRLLLTVPPVTRLEYELEVVHRDGSSERICDPANPHRAADPFGECRHQIGDRLHALAGGLAVLVEACLERLDQRRADHDAIGTLGDGARMRGGTHAETDRDRQRGVALDALHRALDLAGIRHRRAGHAGDRHVVDEARRVREDGRQAPVVGGRCRQPNKSRPFS